VRPLTPRSATTAWATATCLTVAACARGEPPEPAATELAAVLVDSVPYANELADGWLQRVRVTAGDRVDTLDGVLTRSPPVVVGDSAVVGLLAEENQVTGVFVYHAATGAVRRIPAPADWIPFAHPKLAPDGAHVAYLAQDRRDTTGLGYGVVAAVPSMRVVLRGPGVRMLETDAGVDTIEWLDADRFEMRIDRSYTLGGAVRLRGTVRPPRLVVDTVDAAPR
jgi:hypothetical protein